VIYAAILVGGRGNPRGVILGVFVVYIGFIELTRFLPSPASRPDFGPAMRQILIGLMIILMLRFRPEGFFRERPGLDRAPRSASQRSSGSIGALDTASAGSTDATPASAPTASPGPAADEGGPG